VAPTEPSRPGRSNSRESGQEQRNSRRKPSGGAEAKALLRARDLALDEVGITLDRRDREQMHQIVFLLKKSIHEILRQAAFDNRTTMQSILRSGLMMWFVAHGYTVPTAGMKLPRRENQHHQQRK
jgi:hypothetical protein